MQMLQLQHARKIPPPPHAQHAGRLGRTLHAAELISAEDHRLFDGRYRYLRTIEGRLRLMNSTARDTLPHDATELNKLAHLMHAESRRSCRNARPPRGRFAAASRSCSPPPRRKGEGDANQSRGPETAFITRWKPPGGPYAFNPLRSTVRRLFSLSNSSMVSRTPRRPASRPRIVV